MCGIAGIFAHSDTAPPVDADELVRVRDHMRQRGPDGAGLWIAPNQRIGLAHRRLAIIDLSTGGAQPMWTADGRFAIVFNGEIYNYRELRADLEKQGAVFRSQSDTEVVLQLYARDREAMCAKLRGMFAFAIWDTREQEIFLARDPFGIKPIYVHDERGTLRFASQVKALLAGGALRPEVEPAGITGYWVLGHVPEPWTTYRDILSLEPGSWLRVASSGLRRTGQFESVSEFLQGSPGSAEHAGSLRDALLDSVRHHLIADVPVGVFLSSGIDSCTLAALAAECGSSLRTITLGFDEYRGTPADETPLAEEAARRYGARHDTVWVQRREFERAVEEFVAAMDQPSTDGLNTWLVARAAAQAGVKVAISGLGGDEFFGGYPSFRDVPRMRSIARPFAPLGALFRRVAAPLIRRFTSEKYAGVLEYGSTWEGAYLLRRATRMPWELFHASPLWNVPGAIDPLHRSPDFLRQGLDRLKLAAPDPACSRLRSPRAIVSYLEATRYMRGQLLRDSDWAAMAHSVEIRVPFVDKQVVRHVAASRAHGHQYSKSDLAVCARPALPEGVLHRPKTGFTVPVRDWLLQATPAVASSRGQRAWQAMMATRFLSP